MLYLYHGTTSVCAIKARITLHEKEIQWDGEILDLHRGDQHRPEYLKLTSSTPTASCQPWCMTAKSSSNRH